MAYSVQKLCLAFRSLLFETGFKHYFLHAHLGDCDNFPIPTQRLWQHYIGTTNDCSLCICNVSNTACMSPSWLQPGSQIPITSYYPWPYFTAWKCMEGHVVKKGWGTQETILLWPCYSKIPDWMFVLLMINLQIYKQSECRVTEIWAPLRWGTEHGMSLLVWLGTLGGNCTWALGKKYCKDTPTLWPDAKHQILVSPAWTQLGQLNYGYVCGIWKV